MKSKQFLIALDQLCNTLYKDGMADETISARAYRENWKRRIIFLDWVFKTLTGEVDHCKDSYLKELDRSHLPEDYRNDRNNGDK